MIEVLNLGAGVQSSAILLMSIDGDLPRLDHAIFADTGWEPAEVYRQVDWLEQRATDAGIAFHRVSNGNIKSDALTAQVAGKKTAGRRWGSMPFFLLQPDGSKGMIRRQCTSEYKIEPIRRCLRHVILGLKPRQRAPKQPVIRQWFGISFDELQRMKRDEHKWAANWYPLVEMRMTRASCHNWLRANGYHEPPRSACIGCPFHNDREWRRIREAPDQWSDAIEFDREIRHLGGMRGEAFLHRDRQPLEACSIDKGHDPCQLPLFSMDDECFGMCGV